MSMQKFTAPLLFAFAAAAPAANLVIPVDPAQSNIAIELCVSGGCDDDSSPVTGTIDVDIDAIENPTTITLNDLDLALTNDLNLNISFGIFGGITSTATGVTIEYATPGFSTGPVPVVSTAFNLPNVEVLPGGQLDYNASGIVCTALTSAGLPCSDSRDLSMNGPNIIETTFGSLLSVNRVITVTIIIDFTAPLDPPPPPPRRLPGTRPRPRRHRNPPLPRGPHRG
ncbi:MAG: hypothetical protein KDA21_01160 [Phycisphaerales bacterium]|nr:hypothetical protein [Phycisphaerales bacterium]